MPKFDYWNDDYHDVPDHIGKPHGGPHHDNFYDDYPNHHHHPEPPFDGHRHQPIDMGKVDTTKMHDRYDMHVPHHMPPWGFKFPKLEKAFVPGSTPQEQVAYLLNRVDIMIDYFNHYDDKVWGAYNAIVHSALGNDAYYREITREEGYLADGSTPYTVIHIPYLDRADRPIFLELGLAFNNTTNNGVKENVFEASQNRVADKLIPAFNIADGWEGKAMLKGAPIQSAYTEGKFTLAVTDNGFLKIYPNTVAYEQLNRDRIRNAMGVQGVLINNGTKTPEQYATNGGELLARVGIGMNYETKERIIVIVNGNPTPPNDASVTGATADMLADIFARYGCTIAVETANNGSAVAMDKGQMIYMPDTALTGTIPTVPSLNCYWYITKRRHYHNQYVKDVADLIQKVGQNKWRCEIALQSCDFLKGRVNELQRDLDAEVQNRIDADEQLQANIDAEEQARIDADEQLQDNIDAEAEARRQADAQLQDNIDAEATAREQGDNALDTRITNEVNVLNNRITQVVTELNNAIATERQARIDGDTALSTRIDNEVATLNALIDAEEQARIAGDTALQNSLAQLRADYTAFLTTYANDLAETRRLLTALRSDVSTIQGQIANLQSNLSAVNTSITAILATINTIEESFENIKTAFTTLQGDWHDYKDDVDAEIAQLQQEWTEYQATIMSDVETLVREIIAEEGGGITPEIMAMIENAQWKTETSTPLFNETVTTTTDDFPIPSASITFEGDVPEDMITVVFDGVTYELSFDDGYGAPYVPETDSFDFSVYPFALEFDEGSCILYTETSGEHTISVESNSVTYTNTFSDGVKNNAVRWVTFTPPGLEEVYYVADTDFSMIGRWVNNGNYVCGRILNPGDDTDIYFLANSKTRVFARFNIDGGDLIINTLSYVDVGDGLQYERNDYTVSAGSNY